MYIAAELKLRGGWVTISWVNESVRIYHHSHKNFELKYPITFMIDRYPLLQILILLNNPYASAQSMSTWRISRGRVVNQKEEQKKSQELKKSEEQKNSWLVLSH